MEMEFEIDFSRNSYLQYDIEIDKFVIVYAPVFALPFSLKEARELSKTFEMSLEEKIEKYFIILSKKCDIIPEIYGEGYKLLCYYKLKIKE